MSSGTREQKLKRVTESDRRKIVLAVSQNKRSRKWQEAKLDSQFGPHTCSHCRSEPCGGMWPHAACCHRCSHLPMPHWRLSHVLWYRKKPYYVMEVAARRPGAVEGAGDRGPGAGKREKSGSRFSPDPGTRAPGSPLLDEEQRYGVAPSSAGAAAASDAVYYRWDGISQWVRRARTHYFLGVRVSPAEFFRTLPNEEERAEFAPSERPANPFESGITEADDHEGAPFLDQIEPDPVEATEASRFYKQGLQFVDVDVDVDVETPETEGDDG